jgi:hypothetical protein
MQYEIKTANDAKEITEKLKGCVVVNIVHKSDDLSNIYFNNDSYIKVQGEAISALALNTKKELVLI